MMKFLKNTIIFMGLMSVLSGCAVDSQVSKSPYSNDFLKSNFYRGYSIFEEEKSCVNAIKYFKKGADDKEYINISMLYYDYCIKSERSKYYYYGMHTIGVESGDNNTTKGLSNDELTWIGLRADQGGTVENYAIGQMFLNGYMLEKNRENAVYFMTLSAKGGYGRAQMQLAMILMEIGEQQNALLWLKEASKNHYPGAKEMLEGMKLIL
ncbi:sel1 repeat family protein [Vibrio genomosp. F6]|nr:sel1 repeat family protein [Vibrio genomosp. F6]TKF19975.1 sel1 repeat family protein [Vibrio genomosp. F6]